MQLMRQSVIFLQPFDAQSCIDRSRFPSSFTSQTEPNMLGTFSSVPPPRFAPNYRIYVCILDVYICACTLSIYIYAVCTYTYFVKIHRHIPYISIYMCRLKTGEMYIGMERYRGGPEGGVGWKVEAFSFNLNNARPRATCPL